MSSNVKFIYFALMVCLSQNIMANDNMQDGFDSSIAVGVGQTKYTYPYFDDQSGTDQTARESNSSREILASMAYTNSSGLGGQLDGYRVQVDRSPENFVSTDYVAHIFYRSSDFLLGVFKQKRKISNNDYSFDSDFFPDQNLKGVEGQYYLKNLTIYGQFGINNWDAVNFFGSPFSQSENFSTIQSRYFLHNNLRFDLKCHESRHHETVTNTKGLEFGAEFKPDNQYHSFYVNYSSYRSSTTFGLVSELDRNKDLLVVGLKIYFDKKPLLDHDRFGVSLRPVKQSYNYRFR